MKNYLSRYNKRYKLVIGVLSGTSVDAVDVALIKISGYGASTKLRVIGFESFPVSNLLKNFVLKCSSKLQSNVEEICKLNFILGRFFADSVNKFILRNKLTKNDIDLIGSHGQTIYHFPLNKKLFGYNSRSTLQIGDPSVIANLTGILTVGDFRAADVSANGHGAPLAPYLDYILFNSKSKNRAFVNIGGISNATYLKKRCTLDQVIASDTGPGNMMIDFLSKKYFSK
ncbi:MAG: anhydro-N-acetylmuramic acid kinase, partial [bacterium]